MKVLDCTLRDGGYYNNWNFPEEIINRYLEAMAEAKVDIVELGLRSLKNQGFKGACAYTTDDFINSLKLPASLQIGVMINASELLGELPLGQVLQKLFPNDANNSPIHLVRIASHVHEFSSALPAVVWLKEKGFQVGFNLMQIADRSEEEIKQLAKLAADYEIDALYFADSMGSMSPRKTEQIIDWLRTGWKGALGIHTHDNLGLALSNTLAALSAGVTWLDATVTGMGRGPGNARTEELLIELTAQSGKNINLIPLMQLLEDYFKPLQHQYGWGTNPYYYLAGKYGIHPSYVQKMLSDSRFSTEDILAVLNYLKNTGGKKFSLNALDIAREFYHGEPQGKWSPSEVFKNKNVLILGTGPSVKAHKTALERYIKSYNPVVLALNTQSALSADLIDYRIACHPTRLLADCYAHTQLPQPLITPLSMLPEHVQEAFKNKKVLDFGLKVVANTFAFSDNYCTTPASLVMAYAFAVVTSGHCSSIYLAGFDGYAGEDPRNAEMNQIVKEYKGATTGISLISLTPSRYDVEEVSVYGVIE